MNMDSSNKKHNKLSWVLLILLYITSIVIMVCKGVSGYEWLFIIALIIIGIGIILLYFLNLILSASVSIDDEDNERK